MACFVVSAATAVVTTIVTKIVEKKEKGSAAVRVSSDGERIGTARKIPFSKKLKWLDCMLWGGSFLLAFEHIWHGEVVPFFPFLTAAGNPEEAAEMLHEMATTGVLMAALVIALWLVMVGVTAIIEKRAIKSGLDFAPEK
ncbi:MAG: hypothetical protein IJS78_04355 [Clostridia bacterium]|nr:hypothetical protein [Clostridia bacterium]